MSRRGAFENKESGVPVWSWILQEPDVHDDQLRY